LKTKGNRFRINKVDYKKIAEARGVTVHAVRMAARRKILDPKDLKSIAKYVNGKDKCSCPAKTCVVHPR
jgi:hypothetical protein